MMIPPSIFYKMQLEGKSAEEIKTNIRGLKRRINHLKRVLEHPDYKHTFDPAEDVQLWCNREYLKVAIETLQAYGEEYHLTKAEQKALEFNDNILNISKIDFHIWGFFGPSINVTVTVDDKVKFAINKYGPEELPYERQEEYEKEDFFRYWDELFLGEWRKHYDLNKYGMAVCDGTQWEFTIEYNNGRKPFKSSGDNAYPHNFNRLLDCLEVNQLDDWEFDGEDNDQYE